MSSCLYQCKNVSQDHMMWFIVYNYNHPSLVWSDHFSHFICGCHHNSLSTKPSRATDNATKRKVCLAHKTSRMMAKLSSSIVLCCGPNNAHH